MTGHPAMLTTLKQVANLLPKLLTVDLWAKEPQFLWQFL